MVRSIHPKHGDQAIASIGVVIDKKANDHYNVLWFYPSELDNSVTTHPENIINTIVYNYDEWARVSNDRIICSIV